MTRERRMRALNKVVLFVIVVTLPFAQAFSSHQGQGYVDGEMIVTLGRPGGRLVGDQSEGHSEVESSEDSDQGLRLDESTEADTSDSKDPKGPKDPKGKEPSEGSSHSSIHHDAHESANEGAHKDAHDGAHGDTHGDEVQTFSQQTTSGESSGSSVTGENSEHQSREHQIQTLQDQGVIVGGGYEFYEDEQNTNGRGHVLTNSLDQALAVGLSSPEAPPVSVRKANRLTLDQVPFPVELSSATEFRKQRSLWVGSLLCVTLAAAVGMTLFAAEMHKEDKPVAPLTPPEPKPAPTPPKPDAKS